MNTRKGTRMGATDESAAEGKSRTTATGKNYLAQHFPQSDNPAKLAKFWDKFIEREWPDWYPVMAAERVRVFRLYESKLQDPDAHCRLFNGLLGCFYAALVQQDHADDWRAQIKIYRLHVDELRRIEKQIALLRKLHTVRRSEKIGHVLEELEALAKRELLEPAAIENAGQAFQQLDAMQKQPGLIASLVRGKRLHELDWPVEQWIAAHRPGTTRKGGRKGYSQLDTEASVMADIIQYQMEQRGHPYSRRRALEMIGQLFAAYLPVKYVGKTDARTMTNRDFRGNKHMGRPTSIKKRRRLAKRRGK